MRNESLVGHFHKEGQETPNNSKEYSDELKRADQSLAAEKKQETTPVQPEVIRYFHKEAGESGQGRQDTGKTEQGVGLSGEETISSNPKAKEAWGSLVEGSKNIFRSVWSGIRNSEIVGGAIDRLHAGRLGKLRNEAESKIANYEQEGKQIEQIIKRQEAAIADERDGWVRAEALMKDIGMEIAGERRKGFEEKVKGMEEKKKSKEEELIAKQQEIEARRAKVEEYNDSVGEIKVRADGRLSAKMEVNNKAIEAVGDLLETNKAKRTKVGGELQKVTGEIQKIEQGIKDGGIKGSGLEALQESLDKLRGDRDKIAGNIRELEVVAAELEAEIGKYKEKNDELRAEHDRLFPQPKLEKAQSEKGGADQTLGEKSNVEISSTGEMSILDADNRTITLTGNRLKITRGDGLPIETRMGTAITRKELRLFMAGKSVQEIVNSGAHLDRGIIERMQEIEVTDAEKDKKESTVGELIQLWNKYFIEKMGSKANAKEVIIRPGKNDDLEEELELNEEAVVRHFLKKYLTKKTAGKKLDSKGIELISEFMAALAEDKIVIE